MHAHASGIRILVKNPTWSHLFLVIAISHKSQGKLELRNKQVLCGMNKYSQERPILTS